MKISYFIKCMSTVLTALASMLGGPVFAAGLLNPINSTLPGLEMKAHHVNVTVDGVFITTSIEQVFHNPSNQSLEALYSFPVPETAAVGEFIYWVDGQSVIGEVVEKQKARKVYEQEKQAGREAALVEKNEYKTFDISVTPILPQSDVRLRLVYIQKAYVDSNMGRYVYPLEDGGVDQEAASFWQRNEVVSEHFSFNFHLRSAYPIDAIRLPEHSAAKIHKISDTEWRIALENKQNNIVDADVDIGTDQRDESEALVDFDSTSSSIEKPQTGASADISVNVQAQEIVHQNIITLDQDVLVYWRLKEGLPGSVDLVAYKESKNDVGTFMLTLTPGDDLNAIESGRDWVFVLDVSGSMQGKYASLVEGARQAIKKLALHDRFQVIVFNNNAKDLSGGLIGVNAENIERVLSQVASYEPNGGTNLYAGLKKSMSNIDADRPTGIILVTDGVANVGITEKSKFLAFMKNHDVRLFTFIMGNSANRPLLTEMAEVSSGFALSVSNSDDIVGKVLQATSKLNHHAMNGIKFNVSGVRTADVIASSVRSLYRGEQLIVMGHYFNGGDVQIELSGRVAGEVRKYNSVISLPGQDIRFPEIERLWGFAKIDQLQKKASYFGEDADTRQAITDTAINYGLVTDYTSMLVLREKAYAAYDIAQSNKVRVQKELLAREQRDQQMVARQSVTQEASMFNTPRSSLRGASGGGVFGIPLGILLLLSFMNWLRLQSYSKITN